uniref:Uncharacterized protein n=1 Tax=Chlamydomonas leiostraca TaxID=1034604 RepID=A0A7S0RF93_9CHLO|mmetsp:Transcript_21463/g.54648  ORF Transcript_21463/g.54648 Transcript_21463/m.54648 type:complete len:121 (+) Transcript_21463:1836-2198(+)
MQHQGGNASNSGIRSQAGGAPSTSGSGGGASTSRGTTSTRARAPGARSGRVRSNRPPECSICLAAPADAGFMHARSLHQGVCMECGDAVMAHAAAAGVQPMCAFCGQPAERVVKVHVCVD